MDRLSYENDIRSKDPDQNRRRNARFRVGWDKGARGETYNRVLKELSWDNLGWRLGKLLKHADPVMQDAFYRMCVQLQDAQQAGHVERQGDQGSEEHDE